MSIELRTGRGIYRLAAAAPTENAPDAITLTLALERADGIERVVFRCRIAHALPDADPKSDQLIARLAPRIERDFEQIREAALKSIRTERRLFELVLDLHQPGAL
ncbi:MAG TPA: hypothetical protein VKS22_06805 [Candidatus Binataceae bacterium]|nr:hypothetical protein [Candidatus Binataceae bacterium]